MPASIVQTVTDSGGASGTLSTIASPNFGTNPVTGNVIVVQCCYAGVLTTATCADTRGNTYTQLSTGTHDANSTNTHWFYAFNITGGAVNAVTVTLGAARASRGIICQEITGVRTSPDPQVGFVLGAAQNGPGTGTDAITSGNATPTVQPAMAWAGTTNGGNTTVASAAGTGFGGLVTSAEANAGPASFSLENQRITSLTPIPGTFTFNPGGGSTFATAIVFFAEPFAGPSLVQKATNGTLSLPSSFTVQLTGVTAGNFLTLQASLVTPSSAGASVSMNLPTDTNGSWQQGTNFSGTNAGAGSCIAAIAFQRNAAAGTHTVTVSAGGFSIVGHATLSEWSNLPSNASVDTVARSNATTAQTNTVGPTNVTASGQELVLAAISQFPGAGVANIGITDPPTGFTSQYVQNATNAGDIGAEHSYFVTLTAGTQSAQWTWTDATTTLSQAVIAAFTPFGTQLQVFYRLPQHFVDESLILT